MPRGAILRWLPRLFLVVGIAWLVAAAVSLVRTVRFVAGAERASGTVVSLIREADADGDVFYPVVRFTSRQGRRSPFRVDVDAHDPQRGQVRVLTSAYVWFDPTPHLRNRDAVDVYLDPKRPDRYVIDLSFLPAEPE